MKERLRVYVQGLFRGAALTIQNAELKEEILQNTLEHYDDLVAEGKTEQQAYDEAVAGIGDVSQLIEPEATLEQMMAGAPAAPSAPAVSEMMDEPEHAAQPDAAPAPAAAAQKSANSGLLAATWILITAAYFLVSFATHAWYITWIIFIFGASVSCVLAAWNAARQKGFQASRNDVQGAMWTLMTAVYFVVSFATHAWYITWVIFLIAAAFGGVINAVYDMNRETEL